MSTLHPSITAASLWSFCGSLRSSRRSKWRTSSLVDELGVKLKCELRSVVCTSPEGVRNARRHSSWSESGRRRLRSQRGDWVLEGLPLWQNKAFGVGVRGLTAPFRVGNPVRVVCSSNDIDKNLVRGLDARTSGETSSSSFSSSSSSSSVLGCSNHRYISRECEPIAYGSRELVCCNDNGSLEDGQARLLHNSEDYTDHYKRRLFIEIISQIAGNMGKALALGMVITAVGFGPKVLSGVAIAAPTVATRNDVEVPGVELDEEEQEESDDEYSEAEVKQFQRQEELEKLERERQLRAALKIDPKLEELEALGEQAELEPAKRGIFLRKLEEAVRGTYTSGRQLQWEKILELDSTIDQLKKERGIIAEGAENMEKEYLSAKAQLQKLDDEFDDESWERREALESSVKNSEARCGELWQKVSDLEKEMLEKQMWVEKALLDDIPRIEGHAITELASIYERWLQRQSGVSVGVGDAEISRVAKDLELAGEAHGKQVLLPLALGVDRENQMSKFEVDAESQEFIGKIKKELEKTVELNAKYESLVRQRLGKGEDEDISHVRVPVDVSSMDVSSSEFDEDLSEFGDDSRALATQLEWAMGWRAWRDESKESIKQHLLDNPEEGREYVKQTQAQILIARDRVVAETWFNKREQRWEISPMAVSHAVTRKLVAKARVRHDRGVMHVTLKGDDHEYFVDIPAIDAQLQEAGGFDSLYIKLTLDGIPVSTEFMWIPLKEWPVWDLFQLPFKVTWWVLEDIWNSPLLTSIRPYYFKTLSETFEELMVRFGFPVIQTVLPQRAQVALGFDLPEGAEAAEPTDIMMWQQEAQKKTDARYAEGTGSPAWWISLPLRTYVVGIPLYFFVTIVGGLLLAPFTPRKLSMNEAQWKEKKQEELEKEINRESKKDEIDPIKSVFDNMKRVKHPQVRLKDFAGIDAVKEEINEVISFLRNPRIFQEMGARPPRGVLIVGGPGTGKTTLAFAIAAEAKVPMVELQGAELEGGAWVGQGASNVRELFKTAREVSPLIIFMDDFDHFAGVRGATSDTRKQDHESLINQLLVELDGFETQEGVVLIATTSRPYAIDEALRRPGRMDRTIQLPTPNVTEREQILRKVATDTMDPKHVGFVDWAEVADKTAGLTPAQLKCVPRALEANAVGLKTVDDDEINSVAGWLATFNQIMPMWFKKSKLVMKWNEDLIDWLGLRLSKEDLETAVETMDVFNETRPGIELENPPVIWSREYKFPHAVWAAGRALTAFLLPSFDRLDQAWLDPTSWEGIAFTKLTKQLEAGYQETGTMTRSYYEKSLVLCFGSYVAGRLLLPFGENNNLSKGELENAEGIAAEMVMQFGWGPEDSPLVYAKVDSRTSIAMGDKHEEEVKSAIQKLYLIATERCYNILHRNQRTLSAVVEHLLQYDCVTTKDLARITEETGGVFEEDPFELVPYSRMAMLSGSTNGTTRVTKTLPAGASAN
ncbi:probable inactive ATP-dependent zinc metalloprotease FTSHI 5, chloroplastic [Physcomitrium patens]|uniref:AAA+ ATPase domain-containing protein n=1 Tax=Physcomitrium patens TaxID=3218 RepID=A0A2K1KUF1_PHYPA|nr:probable inactive ATP-dependent zinc metalloprotease FTSHI 5, chloroplastic [Physcomitrium patens]PNR57376.1 hypothetical protein PHYPA_004370 [Physcomitrium patens]|eukprot:XP_024370522.1 probable inactive ATP-dependent zinc metalloprotease FTSHI 5, chloroplastic [Physcomitrella patens]